MWYGYVQCMACKSQKAFKGVAIVVFEFVSEKPSVRIMYRLALNVVILYALYFPYSSN